MLVRPVSDKTKSRLTVVREEVGDVVCVALDDDPAILVRLVLGHFGHGNLLGHFLFNPRRVSSSYSYWAKFFSNAFM